jgi:hypothetical protein
MQDARPPASRPRTDGPPKHRRLRTAVRVVGLTVLLAFVASRVDLQAVRASWRGMSGATTALTLACFLTAMALRVAKWSWQARTAGLDFDPLEQARTYLWGILLGVVTPMRLGELWRLSALRSTPETRADVLRLAGASLLLEKGYEVLVLLSLVVVGALFALSSPWIGLGLMIPLLVGGIFGLSSLSPPVGLLERLPAGLRRNAVEPVLLARDRLPTHVRLGVLGLTYGAQALNMLAGLQIYRAFGDIDGWTFFAGMPLLTFTSAVPVTVSGIGLREVAAMELFGRTGYPADAAAVAASLVFVGANVLPTLMALPLEALRATKR